MNDEPDLSPGQEERVRALLADLGSAPDAASMPPEVAARLDETLAGLVAEREEGPADVVPLRRRWAPRAAAAAAAVIVIGAGGVAAANLGVFDGTAKDTASSADSSAGGDRTKESLDGAATTAPPSSPAVPNAVPARLPRVTAASFDTDVARLLQQPSPAQDDGVNQRRSGLANESGQSPAAVCPGPRTGAGSTTTPVLYDGTRAALVIHPAQGGERLVEAWACGGHRVLDSTRVPDSPDAGDRSSPGNGLGSPSPTP